MEKPFETKEVVIKKLMTDGLQIRVEMNEECIEEYADIYRTWNERKADDRLPPITVFYDSMGDEYYLADGFHRVIAAKRAGWQKITAKVYEGTYDEALKFALSANTKHGLRRTNADKRNAMEIAWINREILFGKIQLDVRHFASVCGVSIGNAHNFLSIKGLFKMNKKAKSDDIKGNDSIDSADDDATVSTREHLEERNPKVCALLKQNKDRFGVDIPERIIEAFKSKDPRKKIRELGRIRKQLDDYRVARHPAFLHGIEYALRDLDATIHALRNGQAFCVCRMCRGKGCGSCSNFGFQTRLQYNRVPSEYK